MKKLTLSTILVVAFSLYAFSRAPNDIVVNNTTPTPTSEPATPVPTPTPTDTPIPEVTSPPASGTPPPRRTPTPTPTATPVPRTPTPTPKKGLYTDGQYTGISADAYYGNIQVKAVISGGAITDVIFLDWPQDRGTSRQINNQAKPILRQEAIAAQSANVATVSGASDSSEAFRQSLASALLQAK